MTDIKYNFPYHYVVDEYEPVNPDGLICSLMEDETCEDFCVYRKGNKCSLLTKLK